MVDILQRIFRIWADTLQKWTLCNEFIDFGRTLCKNGHFATIFFILGGHFATTDALQRRILCNSSQASSTSRISNTCIANQFDFFKPMLAPTAKAQKYS
jgi:hypothetical protein